VADRSDPKDAGNHRIDPGLALRFPSVVRRVVSQHQQLEEFARQVTGSTAAGALPDARTAFTRFCDALGSHIGLEDSTVFPAIRGLSPSLAPDLAQLVGDHEEFRGRLTSLGELLGRGAAEEFGGAFASFLRDFEDHEAREEKVVARANRS